MRFSLSPELLERFPTYRVGVVCVWDANNQVAPLALRETLAETVATLPRSLGGRTLGADPRIEVWQRVFESAGLNPNRNLPSVQALAERALRGESIPPINPAVDIANLMSLFHLVPVGAHDMDRLPGDVEVRLSRSGDSFTPMDSESSEAPPNGEPIYATGAEVRTRRWIWRQSERAKVVPESRTILFPVDGFSDTTNASLEQATHELALLAQEYLGRTVTVAFVDASTPSVELNRETATGAHDLETLPDRVAVGASHEHSPGELQGPLDEVLGSEGIGSVRPNPDTALARWSLEDLLRRGLLEGVIIQEELERELASGKRLTIYQGFDPTSTSLHMGHYLSLRILRWFQLHGHRVVFLMGDFTARIGDPTGQSAERQQLTQEQVLTNARTWRDQIAHILDLAGENPIEIKFNGEWLNPLTLKDMIDLAAHVTVQQLIERDMFQERIAQEKPLHLHETLYPLLQGYDSVAMGVDAELGGRDQMFNMMVGRDLVRTYLGKTKHVLMTPLIPGLDGRKMSKTYGNTVDLTEEPVQMFFKLTQVNDDLLPLFLNVFTDADDTEVETVRDRLKTEANLQDIREGFAHEVVELFHGTDEAERAHMEFRRVVDEGEQRSEVPEVSLALDGDSISVLDVAMATGLAESRGDARRLIQQGGFEINEERFADPMTELSREQVSGAIVKMGKRGHVRVTTST